MAGAAPARSESKALGNAMSKMKLLIIAFEPVPLAGLEELADDLKKNMGMSPELAATLEVPAGAYNRRRGQYRSRALLSLLSSWKAGSRVEGLVLGVTDRDIFIPRLNFIFGEADRKSGTALVSLARLGVGEGGDQRFRERLLKESIHELGHLLGLDHCPEQRCIMHYSNTIHDTDFKGPGFCRSCQSAKI